MQVISSSGKYSRLALAVVAALAALASPLASADDTGWYSGIQIGRSRAKIDDSRISSGLQRGGSAPRLNH